MTTTKIMNGGGKITKVMRIVEQVTNDIERGILQEDAQIASINVFSKKNGIGRQTVEYAYRQLQMNGYLIAVRGKGYFVQKQEQTNKVLMILNQVSLYEMEIYDAFKKELGSTSTVNVEIHRCCPDMLREIIANNRGKYDYYAIIPHFNSKVNENTYLDVLKSISPNKLIILDKKINICGSFISVHQDFELDIFEALAKSSRQFRKYDNVSIIFPPKSHHPSEVITGVEKFCDNYQKKYTLEANAIDAEISAGKCFITLLDTDLAVLVNRVKQSELRLGDEVGIVSFNEHIFKDLLGITVVSTDYSAMGRTAAKMLTNKRFGQIRNSFQLISRTSL